MFEPERKKKKKICVLGYWLVSNAFFVGKRKKNRKGLRLLLSTLNINGLPKVLKKS